MRLAGKLKLGFFPLPPAEGPRIRACLSLPAAPTSVLDPCAGSGAALIQITENAPVTRYAIELDYDRAAACRAMGLDTIQGNTLEVSAKAHQVSLLYLNPPYDFEIAALDNRRLELVFLQHCYKWLVPGGILAFVIPENSLEVCAKLLATRFANIEVLRLTEPDSVLYDQIVVFGVRKDQSAKRAEQEHGRLLGLFSRYSNEEVRDLGDHGLPTPYLVPPSPPATFVQQGLNLDALEESLIVSPALRPAARALLPEEQLTGGRPLTPLHGGHVAVLCAAGMMNGALGKGRRRHIAQWRTVKVTTTVAADEEVETGVIETREVERFAREVAFVFANGKTGICGEQPPPPPPE